ncbi:MAG: CPBP family intramembrane metalloprotease, partial [Bacteroidetes bacterium]|nr:CPBP family intramembrane metalloprotease [Bacteroidota bacterium]
MQPVLKYIGQYFKEVNKLILFISSVLIGALIFLNYHFKLDQYINSRSAFIAGFLLRYLISFTAFIIPWILYALLQQKKYFLNRFVLLILLLAPAIFSMKMQVNIPLKVSADYYWNQYWNQVIYWPLRLAGTVVILYITWKLFNYDQPFYGLSTKNLKWKPYIIMILIMIPLIAAASTQKDFLAMYPKLNSIAAIQDQPGFTNWHKVLYELSYGSDFLGIEIFFRGFLVLAFIKIAGKDAILPMACFYCTIHFGKPLGECISSYFGGMLLGIVVANTRSIYGGLMVHL